MKEPEAVKAPFRFYTRLNLSELTGLRAYSIKQLVDGIRKVPGSCIYHHTHRFLQQHQYLSPEPPNDFAYWISNSVGEKRLGEELASIDIIQFEDIATLREKIVATIDRYLEEKRPDGLRVVDREDAFYFIKSISFILPTPYFANNLEEFAQGLNNVTVDSLYFHIFEARLRIGKGANDFSNWIKDSLGEKKVAEEILRLDPYTYTLEELRKMVIKIVKKAIR